tara:strand:+ start:1032 stop:1271 length:240 start_codon:yes stop_codon:yes gene_type:complete
MTTIKIWLLVMIMSTPHQPSVKYTATIYQTEEICIQAQEGYMQAFKSQPEKYKDKIMTEAFCVSFDSFPIEGLPPPTGA